MLEVWTDNGKQFTSAAFAAMLQSVLPGVRHRFSPPYAPYVAGWYEVQHRCYTQFARAALARTRVEDWQRVCDAAMVKINSSAPDGYPSPEEMWYVMESKAPADRFLAAAFAQHGVEGEEGRVDNHGASVREKLVREKQQLDEFSEKLNMLFEDAFIEQRERAAEKFIPNPVKVGDWVRTEIMLRNKLDPFWSEEVKRVDDVRNNLVFVEGDNQGYHARQVKVVPRPGAISESEPEEEGESAEPGGDRVEPEDGENEADVRGARPGGRLQRGGRTVE